MKKKFIKNRDLEVLESLRVYPSEIIAKLRLLVMGKNGIDNLRRSIRLSYGMMTIFTKDFKGNEWQFCFWDGEEDINRLVKWLV